MRKCKHGIESEFPCALCGKETVWERLVVACILIGFWGALFVIFKDKIGL